MQMTLFWTYTSTNYIELHAGTVCVLEW